MIMGNTDTSDFMSYTAKYASALFMAHFETHWTQLQIGDKKTYQNESSNIKEALIEADLDIERVPDFLMVKEPACLF